ncbi:C39 family peptidase [Hyalangium sp.]|uniref:C39 family peptidase n=1 Tax=Hyalangium sp. TaxID=2028555 RepID=UPI002D428642|nr:C39 family peptidase [Hyalangium sp.]HYI01946.1 C39 family peptidase [Hyalangium sp.]
MPRIEGSRAPVRLSPRAEQSVLAQAPQKAVAARASSHSGVSSFQADTRSLRGTGEVAPSGATKLSPNDLGVLAQNQGNTNACGTTSLANVMTHWGKPTTHEQIDQSIRAFDVFTAPDKIVDYARDHGMRAEIKTDASVEDLAKMVDQGVPPIVLMDPDSSSNANLHYVTVSGYNRDASGKISDVVLADSAGGRRYTMPAEEFQGKWGNLKMGGVSTGLSNVMISTVPADGRSVVGGDGVSRKASDIQLPTSSLTSEIKSGFARLAANGVSNVTHAAEKIADGAKKVWDSIFG